MLTISTLPEALAELEKQTGRAWTDSELFDVATNRGVELHAAPPITAQTTIQKFVNGEGLVEKFRSEPGHAALAVLFPSQVGQLWITGETLTSHTSRHDEIEGECQWFTEPVRVTREQVRIKAESLKKIATAWNRAQAGRWIDDAKNPGNKRWQRGPDWMFPADPAPATDTAPAQTETPAPEVSASDMPKPLSRFAAQESAVLGQIKRLGHDPLALPKNEPGKAGTKSAVRKALSKDRLFTGVKVFDKAWERLSANGEIVIQG